MRFDLSFFSDVGQLLFAAGKAVYSLLVFDFGNYSFNGWYLLCGFGLFMIVAKIREILD